MAKPRKKNATPTIGERFRSLLWLANLLVVLATLVAYLSPHINPQNAWPIYFLTLGFPLLVIANLIFVMLWGILFQKQALLSLITLVLGLPFLTSFVGLGTKELESSEDKLRIMSYNIGSLSLTRGKSGDERHRIILQYADLIASGNPDVFCVQELSTHETAGPYYQKWFSRRISLPHVYHIPGSGPMIFSKRPFLNKGRLDWNVSGNACLFVDVALEGGPVRIYNCHLQSNRITDDAVDVIAGSGTWGKFRRIASQLRRSASRRADQAISLASHIASCPHPVIVCGDFNDSPLSFTYKTVKNDYLIDAFQEKGEGLGTTYAGVIPGLKIDHFLADPRINILSHRISRETLSDHYPLITDITLNPNP
ncbi:MAG: endonuclease/exonuclease/phosphatase family protein [Verrucomicrobiota bacterium]